VSKHLVFGCAAVLLMVGNHGKENKDKKRKDFEHADIKHNNK